MNDINKQIKAEKKLISTQIEVERKKLYSKIDTLGIQGSQEMEIYIKILDKYFRSKKSYLINEFIAEKYNLI